ncbi:MAG: hypothetical protein M3069_03350, partial [Chloroflexota bacterium]|nr:hypothetical protein [Chloroflexota bacterium]
MAAAGRLFWRWLAAVFVACLLALLPATSVPVGAHPLGNFTVNRYTRVEIGSQGLRVRYVLDLAEIPSVQETQVADANHDGVVSAAEWDAYRDRRVEELRSNLALAVDGQPVQLQTDESILSNPIGQGNIPLIRIEAWFRAPTPGLTGDTTTHSATFQDRNEPARLGWREIVVTAQAGAALSQSSVPAADTTDELRAYPERFLQDPLDIREANWTFSATPAGSSAAPDSRASGATAGRTVDPFTSLVTAADLNVGVVILALAAAATLGGIHAASPGHGKTVMAAY